MVSPNGHHSISRRVFARIGLLGNPSDGCGGAAIACSITNFFCEVTCSPSTKGVEFEPDEPDSFDDLTALEKHVQRKGYYGARRLLQATCKVFTCECRARGVTLNDRGFKLSYETTIPRQAGLSGSSAIICAAFDCLLAWFSVPPAAFPIQERPSLILSVEQGELGIAAGLMDRVAQVYGGIVYLDLSKPLPHGAGSYEYLPADRIPTLWLIYTNNPSESGRVHAPVKQRWLEGDPDVVAGMRELASIAATGRDLISSGSEDIAAQLSELMNRNFALRRRMYGDAALGAVNIDMINTATSVGAGAKFCGSGGAIVALCSEGEEQAARLIGACEKKGYICVKAEIAARNFDSVSG